MMMRRSSGGNTGALLAKVSSQLRGDTSTRKSASNNDDDDDGIDAYLKSLTRKATTAEPQWDKFGEVSDLSDDGGRQQGSSTAAASGVTASKFMKKKAPPPVESQPQTDLTKKVGKPVEGKGPAKTSTLGKVNDLELRYSSARSSKNLSHQFKDSSDSDLDISMDEEVLADVRALKGGVKLSQDITTSAATSKNATIKPSASAAAPSKVTPTSAAVPTSVFRSAAATAAAVLSDDDDSHSSSVKIGQGGSKFMKKRPSVAEEIPEVREKVMSSPKKDSVSAKASSAFSAAKKSAKDTRGGPGPSKFSELAILDSDDESMAEFIGQLSASSASEKIPYTSTASKNKSQPQSSSKKASVVRKSRSPSSMSEDDSREFRLNIQDVGQLDLDSDSDRPAVSKKKPNSSSTAAKTSFQSSSQTKSKPSSSSFAHLGLHSVDELFGHVETDSKLSSEAPQYESDFESVGAAGSESSRVVSPSPVVPPLRSILSLTPRSLTPKSSRSRVRLVDDLSTRSRTPSPIMTARSTTNTIPEEDIDTTRSAATIRTGSDSSDSETTRAVSDSEVSVVSAQESSRWSQRRSSEPGSQRRRSTPRSGRRSPSLSARSSRRSSAASSRRSSVASYSDDFSATVDDTSPTDTLRQTSAGEEDTQTEVRTPTRHRRRSTAPTKDSCVQTGLDVGLYYSWSAAGGSVEAAASDEFRLAFANPASVATSVISADALQALTSYSPSSIALNDMIGQQVTLTRQFLAIQTRLYRDLATSLDTSFSNYQYTTLEDTKEYIRRHRRPTMTFKQALKEAKLELGIA